MATDAEIKEWAETLAGGAWEMACLHMDEEPFQAEDDTRRLSTQEVMQVREMAFVMLAQNCINQLLPD